MAVKRRSSRRQSRRSRNSAHGTARFEVQRLGFKLEPKTVAVARTKEAAIKKAESLAKRERRPILVHPNGVQEWASFGVFDTRLGHTIGFANPPASGV